MDYVKQRFSFTTFTRTAQIIYCPAEEGHVASKGFKFLQCYRLCQWCILVGAPSDTKNACKTAWSTREWLFTYVCMNETCFTNANSFTRTFTSTDHKESTPMFLVLTCTYAYYMHLYYIRICHTIPHTHIMHTHTSIVWAQNRIYYTIVTTYKYSTSAL